MRNDFNGLSRRQCLSAIGAFAVSGLLAPMLARAEDTPSTQPAVKKDPRYKISACDWIMLKRQTPGAITRAKECGCDGVETDMGPLSKNPTFDNKFLKDKDFTDKYIQTLKETGIEISSIAMSGYYAQSFPERDYEQPLKDCIATCKMLGVKTAFLPMGVYGDMVRYPNRIPVITERLKKISGWAEEAGVTIGIETALDAAGECALLDFIKSPAIKSYYNFENAVEGGRDLCKELQILGKDRICQIHATGRDGKWLKDDQDIDIPKVKQTLDAMGWSGWLVIERSRANGHTRDVVLNFSTNAKYLKSIFQA